MLSIDFIRKNKDKVVAAAGAKNCDVDVDKIISLDDGRRDVIQKIEKLRQERNVLAKEGKSDTSIERGKLIKIELKELEDTERSIMEKLQTALLTVPNIPANDVPFGKDESENKVVATWGKVPEFTFSPKDHVALGEELGIIDMQSAAEAAGSRFVYLLGDAALLQFALVSHVMATLTDTSIIKKLADSVKPGYNPAPFIPAVPPVMINPDTYVKTARLSEETKEERYYMPQDDIYLVGSAEHTLVALHKNKILDESQLPLRYIGYSTAFRREAGSYGKDVKGIIRVHQFDKLEMESFTVSEDSYTEHLFFVAIQEYLLQSLELPYQKVLKCTADIGTPNARGVDLDTWIPSQKKYRETHTADLMTDFQSRRLNTKVRRKGATELVHTNDATAFAIGRTIVAILENYQQEDGSILIPKVLQKYMGKEKIGK